MSAPSRDSATQRVLVGYDGSRGAAIAIETAARLLPGAAAQVVHLWTPPFTSAGLRRRLGRRAGSVDELMKLLEHEGETEAERLAGNGVVLARAAGWKAEPLLRRTFGGEGFELARLAEELRPSVLVVGSRGMSGVRAVLGSVSDVAVHYSPVPVLVVPDAMLTDEREAAATGPVVVGHDGSAGAREALAVAASLFAGRDLVVATVADVGARAAEHGELTIAGADDAEVVVLEGRGRGERAMADALGACAAERGAAAIVVGSRGQSAKREILLGSTAMALLHHGHGPVLVVPSAERLRH